jgi:hypothetical protein
MSELSKKDAGILMVVVERLMKQVRPRLLALKEKVDNGNALNDTDIDFLEKIIANANQTMPSMGGHPELHEFCAHVVHLYKEITEKALENEEKCS